MERYVFVTLEFLTWNQLLKYSFGIYCSLFNLPFAAFSTYLQIYRVATGSWNGCATVQREHYELHVCAYLEFWTFVVACKRMQPSNGTVELKSIQEIKNFQKICLNRNLGKTNEESAEVAHFTRWLGLQQTTLRPAYPFYTSCGSALTRLTAVVRTGILLLVPVLFVLLVTGGSWNLLHLFAKN